MALNDILLHLDTYPEATPAPMIETAVRLAGCFGGKLTALAVQADFPVKSNRVADFLVGLGELAEKEAVRSRQCAQAALAQFTEAARKAGVYQDALSETAFLYEIPELVAARARTRDLCVVPLAERFDGQQEVAQAAVFGSGRPVLVIGPQTTTPCAEGLGTVVVAWDGSRAAARALADALPVLVQARQVQVLTVVNEKPLAGAGLGAEAVRHLTLHGVSAEAVEVDARGRRIGEALGQHLKDAGADILVMGAYGHSRLREFVLGGATEHMLRAPQAPVLMSH